MSRREWWMIAMVFMLTGAATLRVLTGPCPPWFPRVYLMYGCTAFLLIMIGNMWLWDNNKALLHVAIALQACIVSVLIIVVNKESASLMYLAAGVQAYVLFEWRYGIIWQAFLCLALITSLVFIYGWFGGLTASAIYIAAFMFCSLFVFLLEQQEAETRRSQTLLQELREAHQQLQLYAAQEQQNAINKERNRIASELHDSVTQMLFSMNLMTKTALVMTVDTNDAIREPLHQIQSLAQDALAEMRYLIFQLRDDERNKGLLPALRNHIEAVHKRHQLNIDLDVEHEPPLSEQQAHTLFRIIQEALNNIVKHAKTLRAGIMMQVTPELLTLLIKDEGVGFDLEKADRPCHMGLRNMEERAQAIGADFSLRSLAGQGTTIELQLPLKRIG